MSLESFRLVPDAWQPRLLTALTALQSRQEALLVHASEALLMASVAALTGVAETSVRAFGVAALGCAKGATLT